MPFTIKHNKRIKFKGVWKHYASRHFIRPPPHLGEALSSMIQERKIKIEEEEEEEVEEGEEDEGEEEGGRERR